MLFRSYLEDLILARVADCRDLRHVVLMCPAVNEIDLSALEALEELNNRLKEQDISLHLSEVKGPVMDRLERSDLLSRLSGSVFLSQYQAWVSLTQQLESTALCRADDLQEAV